MKRAPRFPRLSPRLLALLALLPLALAAQACSNYSYIDLDIKLGSGFNTVTINQIEVCHMFVTGAATDDFQLDAGLCKTTSPATGDMGMFEYSTFADSGSLTFTLKLFEYPESNAACQIGVGSTTVTIPGSGTRTTGTLTVPFMGPGCK
jgi:hypothetical protein